MIEGLYEQLINKLIYSKLKTLDRSVFYVKETPLDKSEAARVLSLYVTDVIRFALTLITGDNSIERQIEISNKIKSPGRIAGAFKIMIKRLVISFFYIH